MVKRLTILFLSCFACLAQTQIVGPLNSASDDSLLFTGKIRITWPPFVTADHHSVALGFREIDIAGGVLSVYLWPTQGAGPAISYTVTYLVPGLPPITEKWGVPVSASPVSIAALKSVTYASGAGFVILVNNVDASSLANGCLNVTAGAIGSTGSACGSGGGGSAGVNTVTFSSTPNFNLALGTMQTITLASNVNNPTFTNATAGQFYAFKICQNGIGNNVFNWSSAWLAPMRVGAVATKCSTQLFVADTLTSLRSVAPGILDQ